MPERARRLTSETSDVQRAALWSRSSSAPHSPHVRGLIASPARPLGLPMQTQGRAGLRRVGFVDLGVGQRYVIAFVSEVAAQHRSSGVEHALPRAQPPPTRLAAAVDIQTPQLLSPQAREQNQDDAPKRRPIRGARPATFRLYRLEWTKRLDRRPEVVRYESVHACPARSLRHCPALLERRAADPGIAFRAL